MGTPPPGYQQEWRTHIVHVLGFKSLSALRGEAVRSPEFMLVGNPWRLRVYPGGRRQDSEEVLA
jgi:hypothetical protein